jgi:hypothetical protein
VATLDEKNTFLSLKMRSESNYLVGEATILNQYTKIALVESFRLSFQLSLTSYLVVFPQVERAVNPAVINRLGLTLPVYSLKTVLSETTKVGNSW